MSELFPSPSDSPQPLTPPSTRALFSSFVRVVSSLLSPDRSPSPPPSSIRAVHLVSPPLCSGGFQSHNKDIYGGLDGFCVLHHITPLCENMQLCKMAISENGPKMVIVGPFSEMAISSFSETAILSLCDCMQCENGQFRNRASVLARIRVGPFSEWALSESLPPEFLAGRNTDASRQGAPLRAAIMYH